MNNQYLVVRLHGNWIDREQTKKRVKMFAEEADVLDDENIVICRGTQQITKEQSYCYGAFKDYAKGRIAVGIGEFLLEHGLIRFVESEEEHTIKIEGEITVIREPTKGGEGG